MKNKVHVVGAGGIGVVLAWSLARAGWDVTLVERRPEKLAAGRADGLVVAGQAPMKLPFVAFADWQPPADAVILLCTKTAIILPSLCARRPPAWCRYRMAMTPSSCLRLCRRRYCLFVPECCGASGRAHNASRQPHYAWRLVTTMSGVNWQTTRLNGRPVHTTVEDAAFGRC
jgi:hypothetical protein